MNAHRDLAIAAMNLETQRTIGNRDFALVQAIAFFTSLVVVALNLLTDIAYAMADPRIRYGA